MIAATRIHRGPYRVVRRLARKLLKPLLLKLNQFDFQVSEIAVFDLLVEREQINQQMAAEARRQLRLAMRRRELEAW